MLVAVVADKKIHSELKKITQYLFVTRLQLANALLLRP